LNLQSKQNGRVFTLEKACEVMSEVIKGLYDLHEKGYLHRDIKSQNILVKMDNGKEVQFL
jgi:serine/threonine protein kinase